MLAHRPTLPDAFDAAGSVFLPPDPAAADDDDDSFASQDTLLEDARTRHKRLARQRIHEAAGKEGAPRPLPVKQPVVAITPKRVQPPTPSDLAADDVPGLATADVRKELEARGLRAAGPRSIAVARLRHALEPQQKPQATHRGTGTGLFALENFAISPDADRVAFGAPVKLQVSDDEHGAVEYTLRCSKVVGGMHQLYAAWQAPSLTKGQTYEHVFEDVGVYIISEPTHNFEVSVEVYAVTGMKELREAATRRKVEAKRRLIHDENALQKQVLKDAEEKRRAEEAHRLDNDRRAQAQAEREKSDPKVRRAAQERRDEAVGASMHSWKARPRTSTTGTGRRRRLHQLIDESRHEAKVKRPSTSHLAMPPRGQHKALYDRREAPAFGRPATSGFSVRRAPAVQYTAASILALPDRWVNDMVEDDEEEEVVIRKKRRPRKAIISGFAPQASAPRTHVSAHEFKARVAAEALRPAPKRLGTYEAETPAARPQAPPPPPARPEIIIADNAWAPLDLIMAPGAEGFISVHADEPKCVEYQIKCERVLDYVPPLNVELFETPVLVAGECFNYHFKDEGRYEIFDVDAPGVRGVIHVTSRPEAVRARLNKS